MATNGPRRTPPCCARRAIAPVSSASSASARRPRARPRPKLATKEAFDRLPAFVQKSEGRKRWERRFTTPEMFQKTLRDYYRLATGVDREVGRIVALLDELKLADNTIIFFFGDNGYFL